MPASFEFQQKTTTTARRGSQARWDLIHGEFFPFYLILITIFRPCAVTRFRCRYCKWSNSFCDDENLIVKNKHLFTTFIVFYCDPSRGMGNRWKKFVRLKKIVHVVGVVNKMFSLVDGNGEFPALNGSRRERERLSSALPVRDVIKMIIEFSAQGHTVECGKW